MCYKVRSCLKQTPTQILLMGDLIIFRSYYVILFCSGRMVIPCLEFVGYVKCFCKWALGAVWVRFKALCTWFMSLWLLKKAQLGFFVGEGLSYFPSKERWLGGGFGVWGWGSQHKPSWTLNLLRDFAGSLLGLQGGPKPESAFYFVTQHLSSLPWETSRERRNSAPNHKALLKMESLADGSAPVHKIQEKLRGVIRCWLWKGFNQCSQTDLLLAIPGWAQERERMDDLNFLGLRFW